MLTQEICVLTEHNDLDRFYAHDYINMTTTGTEFVHGMTVNLIILLANI